MSHKVLPPCHSLSSLRQNGSLSDAHVHVNNYRDRKKQIDTVTFLYGDNSKLKKKSIWPTLTAVYTFVTLGVYADIYKYLYTHGGSKTR